MRLVYFSPVPWASFAQRSHKFVEWFHSRSEGEVLWVDPYPTRFPVWQDIRRACAWRRSNVKTLAMVDTPAWLSIIRPRSLPIEPLPAASVLNRFLWNEVLQAIDTFVAKGECLIGIGKPSRLALEVLAQHPNVPSLYDAMDDFPAFYRGVSRVAMKRCERAVASRVSRVSVSSTALAERFVPWSGKLALALNACAVDTLPPVNSLSKRSGRSVLGYVGTIGHWFDWSLVFALAEANPAMCIRLIGPVYASPPGPLPPNVELFPACDHASAIEAMQEFTVGLIPFKCTDLTASVDPIKYYEYRALGLPVLSTPFGEMALRNERVGVFFIDKRCDMVQRVGKAISYVCQMEELMEFRKVNSWEVRFDEIGIFP
jgi:hypothetical protein